MTTLYNRVYVNTVTPGQGTVTLGTAFSNAFLTDVEASIADAAALTILIEEGTDFELVRGVYTLATRQVTRATVLKSKISGTAGTTKMTLNGGATVRVVAVAEDLIYDGNANTTAAVGVGTIELGHASDSTIARASAGNLTVEGNALYRAGGTDVPIADGGHGTSTATLGFNALSPVTTRGDIIVRGATNNDRLALGAVGSALVSDGTDAVWGAFPGEIWGLTLSNNSTTSLDVAVGRCSSDTSPYVVMSNASAITGKIVGTAWAVGSAAGSLDTGAISAAWYHAYLIRRPDTGVVDVLTSLSATAPNMPANYTQKRRIGAFNVTSTGPVVIRPFLQTENVFQLVTNVTERTDTADVAYALITLAGVPTGIMVQPILSASMNSTTSDGYILVGDARDTGATNIMYVVGVPGTGLVGVGNAVGGIYTNTSAQIHYRFEEVNTIVSSSFKCRGWIDDRGRSA